MSRPPLYKFRLYVAGDALNSSQALVNLNSLCHQHLHGHHHIDVIDVFEEPRRALADGILMTPTLVKLGPAPPRKIVGTLAQTRLVLRALGLKDTDG
jgi:circadian clock protein KaiB